MCGISLGGGFELPVSLLHHPMAVKRKKVKEKKKAAINNQADITVRVQRRKRRRGKPL